MANPKNVVRSSILVLTLLTASVPVAFAAANSTDPTTTETAAPEEDRGFDDWGLLGLVGLLGLLGLRRDNRNVVVDGTRK